MKTEPMKHQIEGGKRLAENPVAFGLAAEQGTGKTWMLLEDAERQWYGKRITGVLVVAPNGVHSNWIRREIPTHLDIPFEADYYVSGAGKRRKKQWERLYEQDDRRIAIFAINVDAVNTPTGYKAAERFLMAHECMMIVDESTRIKNPQAKRSKKVVALGKLARTRRIASGTMVAGSPLDAFQQFEFLAPRKGLLGTKSYRAFVAEFAQVLPPDNPIVANAARGSGFAPQIVAKDPTGQPIYRNLDRLREMMAPHIFRVRKEDCLDLPPKVYQNRYFELPASQRKVYEQIKEQLRYERDDGSIDRFNALTQLAKLRQVTSGFIMLDGEATELPEDNERLKLFKEVVEDIEGQFIVWAYFKAEIQQIVAHLKAQGISCVEYHGDVKKDEREEAIDQFQSGAARVFVGHPLAGGTGLTLTAAQTAVYYSNDFSAELRGQSEDRCHRKGTVTHVNYIDLVAVDTVDEKIAGALQRKADVAAAVIENL